MVNLVSSVIEEYKQIREEFKEILELGHFDPNHMPSLYEYHPVNLLVYSIHALRHPVDHLRTGLYNLGYNWKMIME